jgi:outer membrane protein OmpU
MKHTLLATTALVAMTGAAAAELTISGTGRIGIRTTEGAAAVTAVTANAGADAADDTLVDAIKAVTTNIDYRIKDAGAVMSSGTLNTTAVTADELANLDHLIEIVSGQATNGITAAIKTAAATDLASLQAIRARIVAPIKAGSAAGSDVTSGVNRFRIAFAGSGETDSGISYGISGRAEQSDSATLGSQYISGAFGKISMGDLGGADKDAAGHIAGGVGLSGMGSNNEILYQARNHNLGYEFSTSGLTFGYSQNTAVQTGSNSAMGIKWSGDMGGTGLTIGVGQSKVGTATQSTMSLAVSTGGLTIKAIQSTNDNGPVVAAVTKARSTAAGTADVYGSAVDNTPDTDHTGVSVSYSMDALSVTAYTKTVSTSGSADKDYTGIGFAYDMGGVKLKAGMVDDDKVSSMDFGLSFSF